MKILISDNISEQGVNILKEESLFEVDFKTKLKKEDLLAIISEYDALVVRSQTKVTKEIIEAAKKLKVIGRAGEGVDNIDIAAATEKGIIVMNTPGGNTISAAEHALSLIMALARNIPSACYSMKNKRWEREKFQGVELWGKTIGVVGLGKIGQEVAKRCLVFGMNIVGYDPFISEEVAKKLNVHLMSFEELLTASDFITIHTPLSSETRHLIGEKELSKMKSSARLINCARGGIVDENALYLALREKKIHSAALDVFEIEPLTDTPLSELENIILTPHLGATTYEAQEKVGIEIAKQVRDALLQKEIKNAVNFPLSDAGAYGRLKPYLLLGEKTGKLLSRITSGRVQKIEVDYSGEICEGDITPLTIALLKGVLEGLGAESVNYVNANLLGRQQGIEIVEKKTSHLSDYTNLISLSLITDIERRKISSTLLGKQKPRIVKIDDFYVDAIPEGCLLLVEAVDVPGVIGRVGTILGKNNINIASLQYGRTDVGERALLVLNIDNKISEEILNILLDEEEIKKVVSVEL